ncbi:putative oxidase (copper-binding protein) [Nocardioides psychrotolerans]|uniref:Multicopper oxidase with three cupredoxin domains (Includes cell division protein FtsP and spore coat protein CotA) n=1 Tax=Nocardioides psychrotolerans TaxID=1005945 RepID=A0A1I3ISH6_9ACTN|nr:multicopper oxidase family protein [Nocardioides psychrotolerans]GEP38118.1 putative oxidase (copper-binding protein) [Nocardioides psychrotolerans]SFI50901.1 Multicopper oxidase with three cupredoxin domains (includes cell division protein FtsP and spore coat protein CotA) [Nocardioides psychrotolerans]
MRTASRTGPRSLSRRQVFQLGGLAAVAVGGSYAGIQLLDQQSRTLVVPGSTAVARVEAARSTSGKVVQRTLTAAPSTVDLGGRVVSTWAYDGSVPGPEIRVGAGDLLQVRLVNQLPDPTTVHWHGLALRNDMDGVPDLTMPAVAPEEAFDYSFVVPDPGTYWFHPHAGIQLDYGMQAALIVEDPDEPGGYDEEVVLVLDDWTDGWGQSPTKILAGFARDGMGSMAGMGGMDGMDGMGGGMGGVSSDAPLGADTGDVAYPAHLINGRLPQDPVTITSAPGRRIRFRLINASGDTAYRFAVGGHRLSVTHTDGYGVEPLEVDTLILGMGERYDVVVEVGDGVFPVVAAPEGKPDPAAMAVLRSTPGAAPAPGARPTELDGRLLSYGDLVPTARATLTAKDVDRELEMTLGMADGGRRWLINGATFADRQPLDITSGERVRITMTNRSMMFHPMHVHGHTFALAGGTGTGVRKDTVNVLPMQTVTVDLQADNPGQWMTHCHNAYHAELGMMAVLSYTL